MSRDRMPKPGETWNHWNRGFVQIVREAVDAVTSKKGVLYRHPPSPVEYFRTLEDWHTEMEKTRDNLTHYVGPRFSFVAEPEPLAQPCEHCGEPMHQHCHAIIDLSIGLSRAAEELQAYREAAPRLVAAMEAEPCLCAPGAQCVRCNALQFLRRLPNESR